MIYTVTLNPAVDEIISLESLGRNTLSSVVEIKKQIGGKGINVGRSLQTLGVQSEQLVLLGENGCPFFEKECADAGLTMRPFCYEGDVRVSHTMVFIQDCFNTHIKRPGSIPDMQAYSQLKQYLSTVVQKGDHVVFSGSVPEGLDDNVYQELIESVKAKGALSFLDASGDALDHGINAFPFCLKINLDEFIDFAQQPDEEISDFKSTVQQLHQAGIALIIITMGVEGAVLYDGNDFFHARVNETVDPLEQRYSVGSGDSFYAGFISQFIEGKRIEDCLIYAAACGSANTLVQGSSVFNMSDVQDMMDKVELKMEF